MNKSSSPDYKDTLNLPRTDFSMKANLSQKEPEILNFWEREDIYARIRELRKGRPKYILHDGPPYANGDIHLGHALNKTLKDIVVRFYTMQGLDAPFIPGWDCHGLPVEHQLFKELGITKYQIGQIDFRKKAYEYAMKYVNIQREQFKRLGVLADFSHPYLTLDPDYEAQILLSFAKLVEKGFIYKGIKPVNWCINCETALAEAEVEYEPHSSASIYLKFRVVNPERLMVNENVYLLVWTTTPWTLVANVAVAVNPQFDYLLVNSEQGILIFAENRHLVLENKLKLKVNSLLRKFPGKFLEGLSLEHPFFSRNSRVVLANFVSKEEGTGCVHIAPGHGEEDYQVAKIYGLDVIMPVDKKGKFSQEAGKFAGLEVFSANREIIKELKDQRALLAEETLEHAYPHCWRCKHPVIFRATAQWFMQVDHLDLRRKAKQTVKKVRWFPAIGENRIQGMLEARPDWCLSRQRYWGVPIPVFYCRNCGEALLDTKIILYIAQLFKTGGSDIWFEKDQKDLLPPATVCKKCNHDDFFKETDILDVWFESGISHQGILNQNQGLGFPADLYLEGSDQHRGWFQTSLLTSLAVKERAPFKAVLTHGFVVDGEGRKMSKSLGNVISPQEIINKFGADILRLWAISSDFTEDIKISREILERVTDVYRKWRNTAKFILGNLYDFDPSCHRLDYGSLLSLDKWALAKAEELLKEVLDSYKVFDFHRIYRLIYQFCIIDMSAIYFDILKDRLYTFKADSRERRSAQTVIYEILNILARLWAPLIPFTAEEIWRHLNHNRISKDFVSVHMAEMPALNALWYNYGLLKDWELLWQVRDIVMRAVEKERMEKIIGDSLEAGLIFYVEDEKLYRYLKGYGQELATLFLVSDIKINRVEKIPFNCFRDEELVPKLGLEVERARGNKCRRCWNWSLSVGNFKEHPDLCSRCVKLLENK